MSLIYDFIPVDKLESDPQDIIHHKSHRYCKQLTITHRDGDFLVGLDIHYHPSVTKSHVTIQQGAVCERWYGDKITWNGLGLPLMSLDPTQLTFSAVPIYVTLQLRQLAQFSSCSKEDEETGSAPSSPVPNSAPNTNHHQQPDLTTIYQRGCRYWLGPFYTARLSSTEYWTVYSSHTNYTAASERCQFYCENTYTYRECNKLYRSLTPGEERFIRLDRGLSAPPHLGLKFTGSVIIAPLGLETQADIWLGEARDRNRIPTWLPYLVRASILESRADKYQRITREVQIVTRSSNSLVSTPKVTSQVFKYIGDGKMIYPAPAAPVINRAIKTVHKVIGIVRTHRPPVTLPSSTSAKPSSKPPSKVRLSNHNSIRLPKPLPVSTRPIPKRAGRLPSQ
jgi:hypothetical protein